MIKVIRSGSHSCIVDNGRFGYRGMGVPTSGPMDKRSFLIGQSMVDNASSDSALELYQGGQEFLFTKPTFICIAGAIGEFIINGTSITPYHVIPINANTTLSIKRLEKGCRVYLCIKGGLQTRQYLASQSPLIGYNPKTLKKGDVISYKESSGFKIVSTRIRPKPIDFTIPLKSYPGPEWNKLSQKQKESFLKTTFTISSQSDRQGYRLTSKNTDLEGLSSILTSPTVPGTIQLPPDGQIIVLMRDGQTTGGYPRISVLDSPSMNQLAQRPPGCQVNFEMTFPE